MKYKGKKYKRIVSQTSSSCSHCDLCTGPTVCTYSVFRCSVIDEAKGNRGFFKLKKYRREVCRGGFEASPCDMCAKGPTCMLSQDKKCRAADEKRGNVGFYVRQTNE